MPSPENDPHVEARREPARGGRSPSPSSSTKEQRRVIELMRRRGRGSSPTALYTRLQELEQELERLRRGARRGPA
jgi:hypothetical protein